jgi:hypothetical protein
MASNEHEKAFDRWLAAHDREVIERNYRDHVERTLAELHAIDNPEVFGVDAQ